MTTQLNAIGKYFTILCMYIYSKSYNGVNWLWQNQYCIISLLIMVQAFIFFLFANWLLWVNCLKYYHCGNSTCIEGDIHENRHNLYIFRIFFIENNQAIIPAMDRTQDSLIVSKIKKKTKYNCFYYKIIIYFNLKTRKIWWQNLNTVLNKKVTGNNDFISHPLINNKKNLQTWNYKGKRIL